MPSRIILRAAVTPTPIIQTPQPTQAGWVGTTYTYTQAHPHAVTALSTGSSYQYDANGNMTCRVENSITYKQTYNAENRISNIMKMDGDCSTGTITESWSFAYDGDGTRTGQVYANIGAGSTLTTRYFMGGAYETTDDTSTVTIRKYYGIAGMTVAMNDGNGMKYLLTDHLGSVVTVTDSSGSVLSQQRYLPFGQVRTDVGPSVSQTDFGYTGQRALDNGLMDYHARFYDAYLNRWTQPDSIIPSAANPQSLNRFTYGLNNPSRYTDPSGHKPCWATAQYSCHLNQDIVEREYGKYSDKDKTAVAAFFASQGWQVSTTRASSGTGGFATPQTADYPAVLSSSFLSGDNWWSDPSAVQSAVGWLRPPDYWAGQITIPIPNQFTGTLVGITIWASTANGHWYIGAGPGVGRTAIIPVAVNGAGGWLLQSSSPSASQVHKFLTGWTVNISGGFIVGLGGTWGNVGHFNLNDFAGEGGLYSPQIGGSATYTIVDITSTTTTWFP